MSIPKSITFSKGVVESTQGDGTFEPLPAGNYDATIFSIKAGEFGAPKEGKGDNSGKPYWNVQYRIEDGQYANRRLFQMVGLFTHWAPKPGSTEEPVNFNLPQFLKAVGVDVEEGEVEIPDPEKLGGHEVTLRVIVKEFPVGSGNKSNEVKAVLPRGAATAKAKVAPTKPKTVGGKTVL
jgi:hypothetical protein